KTEVTGVSGEKELGVNKVGIERAGSKRWVDGSRGEEEAFEPQLGRLRVRDLDHPFGGQVPVEGNEHHGAVEDWLSATVTDTHHRGVPVTREEELGAFDVQWMVDLDRDGSGLTTRCALHAHSGLEVACASHLGPGGLELGGEVVERERERAQRLGVCQGPGGELVVLQARVRERAALN